LLRSFFEIAQDFIFAGENEALRHFFDRSPFQSDVPRSQSLLIGRAGAGGGGGGGGAGAFGFARQLGRGATASPRRRTVAHRMKRAEVVPPLQLFHRIGCLDEHCEKAGVRIRVSVNGCWEDAALAERCVAVFAEQSDRTQLEFVLLLCIFLARVDAEQAVRLVAKLQITPKEAAEFDHLLATFAQYANWEAQPAIEKFERFCEVAKTYAVPFIRARWVMLKTIGTARKGSECLIAQINEQVLLAKNERPNGNLAKLDRKLKETAEAWSRLWRCMTVYRAPWSPFRGREGATAWKRDPFLCRGLYPPKLQEHVRAKAVRTHPKSLSQWFAAGTPGAGAGAASDFQAEIVGLSSVSSCLV
jgi:hypothetical protein